MPRMKTTVGQLLVNRALPHSMRDYSRTLNKKALGSLLRELALKHPDRYRQVSKALADVGWEAAYTTGGQSFGLRHLQASPAATTKRQALRIALAKLYSDESLDEDTRDKKILAMVGKLSETQEDEIFEEQAAAGNPLTLQVQSGSRGNKMNLASLLGSDLLYTDHRGRVIPFPVLKSYSQGLTPAEYWAGAYGARKGVIDLKMATQDAGFLSKQLNQAVHRGLVTAMDADTSGQNPDMADSGISGKNENPDGIRTYPATLRGLPVAVDDADNEGALLAQGVGGYRRNTILTPKILEHLLGQGIKRILIRSPAVGGPADGGVYARDVGVREFGKLPVLGENVSLAAVQALSEPLTQAQISSKHSGGVATAHAAKAIGGFDYINQLIQVPKVFKGGAAHARHDGTVQLVEAAPAGGHYVTINGEKHYVGSGYELKVKQGDKVEAGDVLSEGTPNPAEIVKYKGIGEGRRYFVKAFRDAFVDAGLPIHRRNVELLSRGLINHVRMTDESGDHNPDDVIPYARLEHTYEPRANARRLAPKAAVGQHLERPVLHYTIGTRVRPSMVKELEEFGVKRIDVHEEPPPFEAEMVRGMANLQHDPDWLTRMFGSGLQKSLFAGVHRGAVSDPTGTSFVPGLSRSVDFGRVGKVQTPKRISTKLSELRERVQQNKQAKKKVTLEELRARVREKQAYFPLIFERPERPKLTKIPDDPNQYLLPEELPEWQFPETATTDEKLQALAEVGAVSPEGPLDLVRRLVVSQPRLFLPMGGFGMFRPEHAEWLNQQYQDWRLGRAQTPSEMAQKYNKTIRRGFIPDDQVPQMTNVIAMSQPAQPQPAAQPAQPAAPQVAAAPRPAAQPGPQPAQPAQGYTPGPGLMPLYQMAPQHVGRFLQNTGPLAPLGMVALADMNAFKTLTTPPKRPGLQQTPQVAQNLGTPKPPKVSVNIQGPLG